MAESTQCDQCVHYLYDEVYEYSYCNINLDEDEMLKFLQYNVQGCNYFQLNDDYKIVRKQN